MVGTMIRSGKTAVTTLVVVFVLFGPRLQQFCLSEEQGASPSLRRRSLETDQRNHYWDVPTTTRKVQSTTRQDNPYWQLPPWAIALEASEDDASADDTPDDDPSTTVDSEGKTYLEAEKGGPVADKFVPTLSTATVEERASNTRDGIQLMRQSLFVEQCLNLMDSHANRDKLNRQSYVSFLQEISNDALTTRNFADLPLFLSMIFFSASCSNGEDCVSEEPAITIHPAGSPENQMNLVLCHQLMRFPFMEVLLPFQFLIRLNSGLSASDLMVVSEEVSAPEEEDDIARLVPSLEGALDQALLQGFNCSYVPGEPVSQRATRMSPRERSKHRQPQPQGDCDYVVQVSVEDAADYRKFQLCLLRRYIR